ncbi:hypothetical protein CRG98_047638 [Punica granatum]|uniref:ABC-2 type transporter transmembrane domain-containing protein n=1 Tax=Punica granatum TaxID=22663 RepID=A0A2I0HJX5_PUNGR|nr:hypothetical protein CRG98_047638 [Punica granatum]
MHEGIGCFLYFLWLLFTSMMAVEGMMMVIASIVPNFLMGIIAATGVQGLMILGAGIYRLPKDIPKPLWKYPIYYIALHRYAYQGLCKNEFEGLEFQIQLDGAGQHMLFLIFGGNGAEAQLNLIMGFFLSGRRGASGTRHLILNNTKNRAIPTAGTRHLILNLGAVGACTDCILLTFCETRHYGYTCLNEYLYVQLSLLQS